MQKGEPRLGLSRLSSPRPTRPCSDRRASTHTPQPYVHYIAHSTARRNQGEDSSVLRCLLRTQGATSFGTGLACAAKMPALISAGRKHRPHSGRIDLAFAVPVSLTFRCWVAEQSDASVAKRTGKQRA